LAPRDVPPQ
jgi:hypothetical protein